MVGAGAFPQFELLPPTRVQLFGAAVDEVISENPAAVADIRAGENKAIGFLTGQIMKKTRGQANAGVVQQLIRESLEVE